MAGDAQTGANCMRGRENHDAIASMREDVQRLNQCRDRQVEWNHSMDLRVSRIEWRTASWAAVGAIIGGLLLQLVMHLVGA